MGETAKENNCVLLEMFCSICASCRR